MNIDIVLDKNKNMTKSHHEKQEQISEGGCSAILHLSHHLPRHLEFPQLFGYKLNNSRHLRKSKTKTIIILLYKHVFFKSKYAASSAYVCQSTAI